MILKIEQYKWHNLKQKIKKKWKYRAYKYYGTISKVLTCVGITEEERTKTEEIFEQIIENFPKLLKDNKL